MGDDGRLERNDGCSLAESFLDFFGDNELLGMGLAVSGSLGKPFGDAAAGLEAVQLVILAALCSSHYERLL
jgi:hypothetical protein